MKTSNSFAEGLADASIFEDHVYFNLQNFNAPGPGDEEDNEDEDDKDEGSASGNNNDDPPIDEEVVHSPVPTQPGGKPK